MLRLPLCCLTGSLSAGSNLLHVTAKLTNFSKYVSTFHFIFYISYVVRLSLFRDLSNFGIDKDNGKNFWRDFFSFLYFIFRKTDRRAR